MVNHLAHHIRIPEKRLRFCPLLAILRPRSGVLIFPQDCLAQSTTSSPYLACVLDRETDGLGIDTELFFKATLVFLATAEKSDGFLSVRSKKEVTGRDRTTRTKFVSRSNYKTMRRKKIGLSWLKIRRAPALRGSTPPPGTRTKPHRISL